MVLILSIAATAGAQPGEATRQVFTQQGGTIGRAGTNSWVLTHNKVSGRHAVITCRGGVFYIQDTSRNGIAINSRENRLVRERPYPLHDGDCIFIEPYEIEVAVEADEERVPRAPAGDPFAHDPFAPASDPLFGPAEVLPAAGESSAMDPVQWIEGDTPAPSKRAARPARPAATSADDLLQQYVEHAVAIPDPSAPRAEPDIPPGYNPLAEEPVSSATHRERPPGPPRDPAPPLRPKPGNVAARPPRAPVAPPPPLEPGDPLPRPLRPAPPSAVPVPAVAAPDPRPAVPSSAPADAGSRDLVNVLIGAGVPDAVVTPELAHDLGEILRVVVAGLMDVLRARHRIKEEFGMRHTVFQPAQNNPLKFSANVEDALHNLLVKRNAAFLGPVEAFADAFADLRHHELAMLSGMRVAFDAMLATFDPDALQQEFDRQIGKRGLPLVPGKLRYWDLFREKCGEMAKDPDATFVDLFGEAFARAYEEQFRTLKAQSRGRPADGPADVPPLDR